MERTMNDNHILFNLILCEMWTARKEWVKVNVRRWKKKKKMVKWESIRKILESLNHLSRAILIHISVLHFVIRFFCLLLATATNIWYLQSTWTSSSFLRKLANFLICIPWNENWDIIFSFQLLIFCVRISSFVKFLHVAGKLLKLLQRNKAPRNPFLELYFYIVFRFLTPTWVRTWKFFIHLSMIFE